MKPKPKNNLQSCIDMLESASKRSKGKSKPKANGVITSAHPDTGTVLHYAAPKTKRKPEVIYMNLCMRPPGFASWVGPYGLKSMAKFMGAQHRAVRIAVKFVEVVE